MKQLSTPAQRILEAYQNAPLDDGPSIAAVLRATALYSKRDTLLLLSIADELEGN